MSLGFAKSARNHSSQASSCLPSVVRVPITRAPVARNAAAIARPDVLENVVAQVRLEDIGAANHVHQLAVPRDLEPHGPTEDLGELLAHHHSRRLRLLTERNDVRDEAALLEIPHRARAAEARL